MSSIFDNIPEPDDEDGLEYEDLTQMLEEIASEVPTEAAAQLDRMMKVGSDLAEVASSLFSVRDRITEGFDEKAMDQATHLQQVLEEINQMMKPPPKADQMEVIEHVQAEVERITGLQHDALSGFTAHLACIAICADVNIGLALKLGAAHALAKMMHDSAVTGFLAGYGYATAQA